MGFPVDQIEQLTQAIMQRVPQKRPPASDLQRARLVAHRGAWNTNTRLENTMAAFLPCMNSTIWGIEFDIRWTKDHVPVVHHDPSSKRVFHQDLEIDQVTFAQLRNQLPQIPSLQEVVEQCGQKLHLMIELKTLLNDKQVEVLKEILGNLQPIKDYHLMSLQMERFRPLHHLPRQTFVSIARLNIHHIYKESLKQKIGGFTGQCLLLNKAMMKKCHNQNMAVGTGFSDSQYLLYREINRGVDWIFTNKALEISKYMQNN